MNDAAIKNFCSFAREQLTCGVELRMARYGVTPEADAAEQPDAVGGVPLSPQERAQRADLLRQRDALGAGDAARGWARLRDRAAYTWFNRIVAIRFMELRDYLPSRARMFSDEAGALGSQALDQALDVEIGGMDPARVVELKQAGDDEALFRYLLLCQCRELAACLPGVFEPVGDAMELLLPDRLMAKGGVIEAMVEGIPEADWLGHVEILGWMYQYYNAEAKDAFFKSKDKATPETLPAATQLFTPEWIVRYMVQNSLGRLWMLNNSQSALRERMEYYIEPDAEHEDFIAIAGPEDIALCDPACGSGHILVYAFELLFEMYQERGYRDREIPSLILQKNLRGLEIDPRAAQLASLALAMCAREHDRRFFGRGVRASVRVVAPVVIGEDELPEGAQLCKHPQLLEALAHLGEVGSLLNPTPEELAALTADAEALSRAAAGGDMFADNVAGRVAQAKEMCDALAERYDCVVANPPYMGSSSFSPFMSKWVKKNYPDVKSDLCTCFIERAASFTVSSGYSALVTAQVWMFLSSFNSLRNYLIDEKTLITLIDTKSAGLHADNFTANCAFVLFNGRSRGFSGAYIKLNQPISGKAGALKEAIQNPDCGWFYRRNADAFKQIPGSPIAYWASESIGKAFTNGCALSSVARPLQGMATGDNDTFLRLWWEIARSGFIIDADSEAAFRERDGSYCPHNKGGSFRRWYGNQDYVLRFDNENADQLKQLGNHLPSRSFYFRKGVSYSDLTSGLFSARKCGANATFDTTGPVAFPKASQANVVVGLFNSTVFQALCDLRCTGLHYSNGTLATMPFLLHEDYRGSINELVMESVHVSKLDWDSFETSWDFKRHPLL